MASQQTQSAVDEIRQLGSWDPAGPDDLHGTLRTLSGVSEAVAGAYRQIAETLLDCGVTSMLPDILHEAASMIEMIADDLAGTLDKGLMDKADGARSAWVDGVIEEIRSAGSWTPDDPKDEHETIKHLGDITLAVSYAYNQIAATVKKTGAHESYPPALAEAAQDLYAVAEALAQYFGEGVTRKPG